ncbi:hypothetical protein ACHAXT_011495 [Thalassiosira profunda]
MMEADALGHSEEPPATSSEVANSEDATVSEQQAGPNNSSHATAAKDVPPDSPEIMAEQRTHHVHSTNTKSEPPPFLDEERIEKARSFLRNAEIRDVPAPDKRRYLQSKVGLTPSEIDAALERAAETEGMYPPQYTDGPPHMQGREETEPPPSLFPAWAGGFSLGVFCLAALRWLNGGDFVLFPSPTAAESLAVGAKRGEAPLASVNEEETDESESQEELPEESEDEYEEYDPNEEDDKGLGMLLNGTANAQDYHHPDEALPSYNELVLEIRSLTSAIHSYRDVQERANRAATAQAGRGVTNDAMDFLRQKKASDVEQGEVKTGALEGEAAATIASLLTEMSGDLSTLKESFCKGENGSDAAKEEDLSKGEEQVTADEDSDSTEDPSTQIDTVLDKIQKILAIVETKEENESDDLNQGLVAEAPNNEAAVESESSVADGPAASAKETDTPSIDSDEKKLEESKEPMPEQSDKSEEPTASVEDALQKLSTNNDPADLKLGAQMLYLYCLNISKNPTVPRYRKIYTNNNTYRNKVGNLVGAKEFLVAVGFVERTNFFEWAEDDTAMATKSRLDFALVALELMKSGPKAKEEDVGKVPSESSADASETPGLPLAGVDQAMDLN